jgi:NADH-quinone oxidoreductase subunit L
MSSLTLALLLPLVGFLINGLGGRRLGSSVVSIVGCGCPIVSFILTVGLVQTVWVSHPVSAVLYAWSPAGSGGFSVALEFDRIAAVMMLVVTGVGSLIHLYSIGYMRKDPGYARYFAYLNLFLFFMILLVTGKNLLVLFVGWEGVGLCSYLLIGFWFTDVERATAGKKALIVNRIGDAGFLLGIFLLYAFAQSIDFSTINSLASGNQISIPVATVVGLLLFLGACGKSAQIPLHVWLPDAMAGPTPVSALIHAATMVTAGVYMIIRMNALFMHAPVAMEVITLVGAATAFLGGSIGLAQDNIKKVLAYSTISQLGFMFMAVGVGAFSVGLFHLYTHAFFKAALFLGAGAVIHALGGEEDIWKMGGLRKSLPVTSLVFLLAALSLAEVPPTAGFFSKEEILWSLYQAGGGLNGVWLVALMASLMTSIYIFRLFFVVFCGPSHVPPDKAPKVHEAPGPMRFPLIVLGILSAIGGFVESGWFMKQFLGLKETFSGLLPQTLVAGHGEGGAHGAGMLGYGGHSLLAVGLSLAGIATAWVLFQLRPEWASILTRRFRPVRDFLSGSYYIDGLYQAVLVNPYHWVSKRFCQDTVEDSALGGAVRRLTAGVQSLAALATRPQNGNAHAYALYCLIGLAGLLLMGLYYG